MSAPATTVPTVEEHAHKAAQRPRTRPLYRRVGAATSGIVATTLATVMVIYLFLLPFAFAHGPDLQRVWTALKAFGAELDDGAVGFQGIVLGVLGALFIGRILAPVADVKHEQALNVGTAFAGHLLASFVAATAVFTSIGVAGDRHNAAHIWFFVLVALTAYALSWAIDAGLTMTRKRQRRRARAALIASSWRVHRRAARLLGVSDARTRSGLRAAVVATATIVVATAAAAGPTILLLPVPVSAKDVTIVIVGAAAIAVWALTWVFFVIITAEPDGTWFTTIACWALAVLATLAPAIGIAFVPAEPEAAALKVGILVAAASPFVQLLLPMRLRFGLRSALVAVQLRQQRIRRLTLLRDWYALAKKKKSETRRNEGWEALLRAALTQDPSIATPPTLHKTASLRRHRPEKGVGSDDWWEAADQPLTFPPLHGASARWAQR